MLLACEARAGFELQCQTQLKHGVTVTSKLDDLQLDQSKSIAHLTAINLSNVPQEARVNAGQQHILGLTKIKSNADINSQVHLVRDRETGRECGGVQIEVKLAYVPVLVHIAQEIAPGTCAYEEVLQHEMRHVNSYARHLPKVEVAIKAELERRFPAKPQYFPRGGAFVELQNEINQIWMPKLEAMLQEVEKEQVLIDTPQEYARMSAACDGQVQKILRRVKRS